MSLSSSTTLGQTLWNNKRNKVLNTFTNFKKKQQKIESDPDLSMFLQVFMNTVTSSYRIAEMMNSGKFEEVEEDSFIIDSLQFMLELIPVIGGTLGEIAGVADKIIRSNVAKKIEDRISNTINSFYHKEIESEAENVCVSFLYTYEMKIKERIMNRRNLLKQ